MDKTQAHTRQPTPFGPDMKWHAQGRFATPLWIFRRIFRRPFEVPSPTDEEEGAGGQGPDERVFRWWQPRRNASRPGPAGGTPVFLIIRMSSCPPEVRGLEFGMEFDFGMAFAAVTAAGGPVILAG